MIAIKQYGLQRSGTNYTRWLIENNFQNVEVLVNKYGNKHFVPEKLPNNIKTAITVKNPYSWYLSRYKLYIKEDNFGKKTGGNRGEKDLEDFIESWNYLNGLWFDLHKSRENISMIVKYEDLLLNRDDFFNELINKFNLIPNKEYKDVENIIRPPHIVIPNTIHDRNYYIEEKYMDEITEEQLLIFRKNLSKKLMDAFGYEIK